VSNQDVSSRLIRAAVATAIAASLCGVAYAQSASATAAKKSSNPTIASLAPVTITGTIIQGVAPVGIAVTTINTKDIFENGSGTTQDLLATSPILGFFNSIPAISNGGQTSTSVNIHGLPGDGADGTLELVNGMDSVGAGVLYGAPDIGIIPPGALKSVQIVANGGDAIYGADAVGGIVNLITRKGMKGVKVYANYGWASGYSKYDAGFSFGNEWNTGSYIVSYDHESRQPLFGASRGYYRSYLPNHPTAPNEDSNQCDLANVIVGGQSYAMPSLVPGSQNLCDPDLESALIQPQRQNTLYFGMRQALTSSIRFSLTAYWSGRSDYNINAAPTGEATITNANPYFIPINGATSELVDFSYAPAIGSNYYIGRGIGLHEISVTPKLTFKLPHDWTLSWATYFGQSVTTLNQAGTNSAAQAAALSATTTADALDPYNIENTAPSVINSILDYQNYFNATQKMLESKVIAQGGIAKLPGGEADLAVGAQFQYQSYDDVDVNAPIGDHPGNLPKNFISQGDSAAFGELRLPIISPDNGIPGIHRLVLDAQGRIDHYTSWGSTVNPRFAADWSPVRGLHLFGTWGKSFIAPGLSAISTVGNQAQVVPDSPWGPGPYNTQPTILMAGTEPGLGPEHGTTYTAGFSVRPVWLPGTYFRLTYWHINITNEQSGYPWTSNAYFFDNYPAGIAYIEHPTPAQLDAFITKYAPSDAVVGLVSSLSALNALYNNPATTPWVVLDAEGTNFGSFMTDGLDFTARYHRRTSYGELLATAEGTYSLQRQQTQIATLSQLSQSGSRLLVRGTIGDQYHRWFLRFAVDYSSGYRVFGVPDQTRVGSFHPVNATLTYHLKRHFGVKHVVLMFKVVNIANEEPSYLNEPPFTGNGNVLGREFQLGFTAKY
jgi:iron complex outermembrane receptor protein